MKRLALAMLALVIALPLCAGALDNAVFSISGSARTTWGIDLETMATGFKNTLTAKLRLDFKPEATATQSGSKDAKVYGEIKFDEISIYTKQINNTDDNDADIEMDIDLEYAKIIGPNWWVSVKGQDDAIDFENGLMNGILRDIVATRLGAWDKHLDLNGNDLSGAGGFEGGFSVPDVVGLEVSFFSLGDGTTDEWLQPADQNAYGFKAEASLLAVKDMTAKAAINMGFGTDVGSTLVDNLGFGALFNYKLMLGETMYIKPEVGVDVKVLDGGGMDLAIGNGLLFFPGGAEVTVAEDAIQDRAGGNCAWDDGVNAGLTLGYGVLFPALGSATPGDVELALMAHYGFSMIDKLMVAVGFEAADILNPAANMGFAVYGQYDAGVILPRAGMFMMLDKQADGGVDGEMIVEAGFAVPKFVPLTSLYVDWNSGNLLADDVGDDADLGILQVGVEVAY